MPVRTPDDARAWVIVYVAVYEDPENIAWHTSISGAWKPIPRSDDGRGLRIAFRHLCGAIVVPEASLPSARPAGVATSR